MKNKNLSNVVKIAAVCVLGIAVVSIVTINAMPMPNNLEATVLNSAAVTAKDVKDGFVEEFKYGAKLGEFKDAPVENANNPAPSATMRPFRTETAVNVANVTANDVKDAPVENGWGYVLIEGKENEYVQQLATGVDGKADDLALVYSKGDTSDKTEERERVPGRWAMLDVESYEDVQQLATGENEKLAEELKDDRISDVDAVGDGVGQEKVPRIPGTRSETTEIVYDINELQDTNELIAPEPTKADNTSYLIGGGVLVTVLLGGGYAIYRFKRQTPEQ